MQPERITFFEDRFSAVYGAQENLLLLAVAARDSGIAVEFATIGEGPLAEAARARGLDVRIVPAPAFLRTFRKGWIRGRLSTRLSAAVQAFAYSIRLHRQLLAGGTDLVVASSIRSALLLSRTRLSRRVRTLLFVQNSTPFGAYAVAAAVGTDRIALISRGSGTTFPRWSGAWLRGRTTLLPSGRDLERFVAAGATEPASVPADGIDVLTICSINERKGLHVLARSIAEVRARGVDCRMSVVGDTSDAESERYLEKVRTFADDNGVPLALHGWQDDVVPFLAATDIFALASFNEGLPGVIIEAMAAGLPVVATDAGGCAEIVDEGSTGYIVPVGDTAALADRIHRLATDAGLRDEMARRGRLLAAEDFTLDAFRRRLLAVVGDI